MKFQSLAVAATTLLGCAAAPRPRTVAETIARFSTATVARDVQTMAGSFTPDATWEASGDELGFHLTGIDQIRAAFERNFTAVEVVFQQVGVPEISLLAANHASARTTVFELLRVRATGVVKQLVGVYHDELVRRGDDWLFARRRFELQHAVDLPSSKEVARVD